MVFWSSGVSRSEIFTTARRGLNRTYEFHKPDVVGDHGSGGNLRGLLDHGALPVARGTAGVSTGADAGMDQGITGSESVPPPY